MQRSEVGEVILCLAALDGLEDIAEGKVATDLELDRLLSSQPASR